MAKRREKVRHAESSAKRGYDHAHRKLRAQWARKVEAGGVCCARCGRLIVPGTPWDLGHADHDRSVYVGPEHRHCNRATAGRQAKAKAPYVSREW